MITAKRYCFDIKTNTLDVTKAIPVDLVENQRGEMCWRITTHDHNDKEYYQIAFSSSNNHEVVSLQIESPMLTGEDRQGSILECKEYSNQLWLWSQDCVPDYVTCAGIFRVTEVSLQNGEIIDRTPWIYCLPSSMSIIEYQIMLYDLIGMHDKLVKNHDSKMSAGSYDIHKWFGKIQESIKQIERRDTCATILKKKYVKSRMENIRHFDNRVIQSYVQNGMSGIAYGIVYEDSNDVYENRIIKSALLSIASKLKSLYDQPKAEKEREQEDLYTGQFRSKESRILEQQRNRQIEWKKAEKSKIDKQRDKDNKDALNISMKIEKLLNDKWFSTITEIEGNVFPIPSTPLFSRNQAYSSIARLLDDFSSIHAAISCDIDINGFGVKKTCDIYELWILYTLLFKLDSLGFVLESDGVTSILDDFKTHIRGNKKTKGYKVVAEKKLEKGISIQIEFGYNCQIQGYTPDYYIKVIRSGKAHWYIMDAKYKCYNYNGKPFIGSFSLAKEMEEISYKKYTLGMNGLRNGQINGSYLLVASIDKRPAAIDDISKRHFLFGGKKSFDGDNVYPDHKYGAIQITPYSIFELDILLKLIFEYKESEDRKQGETPLLAYCWQCGKKMKTIPWDDPEMGHENRNVIYRKCDCEEFRVESYCKNCLSLLIKHAYGNYHYCHEKNRWNIVCPHCGDHL